MTSSESASSNAVGTIVGFFSAIRNNVGPVIAPPDVLEDLIRTSASLDTTPAAPSKKTPKVK